MKQLLSVILASSTLLLTTILPGCSDANEIQETNPPHSVIESIENNSDITAADEETRPMHAIPEETDYEGAHFHIMYPDWQGYKHYFFADETTGEVMNDAIYSRTMRVEEYLNIDLTQYAPGGYDSIQGEMRKAVTANDNSYQLALTHCTSGTASMMTEGYLYNFDDLPNVDYTQNWWNRKMMDTLRVGLNTYYGISDYMIPCPYAIFFSKDLIEQFNLKNPYELVYNGEWTLDEFFNMAQSVIFDADGDGKITTKDTVGICAEEPSKYISFMTGSNQFMTSRDEDGKIFLNMHTEKTVALVERFAALADIDGVFMSDNSIHLEDGNLLFELDTIAHAVNYRETEVDVGILPYPKYDIEQEDYLNFDWSGFMAIPITIPDPDMVGAVVELLSYETGNEVLPTYYDVLLDGKLARDIDTHAMLDILFDTLVYDAGGNYFGHSANVMDIWYIIPNLGVSGNTNFTSWYRQRSRGAENIIKTFYKALDKIES